MRIVILDGSAANPGDLSWTPIAQLGELVVHDFTQPEQTIPRLQGAQVALTNKTVRNEAVFAACPDLRYVGVLATGYNVVDLAAARVRGILVTNIPAYSTDSVAQFVFALLLELCSKVALHDQAVRDGEWARANQFCFWKAPLVELAGKTMGLVGYGNIGSAVARIALAFGMQVLACTPHPEKAASLSGVAFASLDEVLAQSDVVSLHCPLFDSTRRLIRAETIATMKDGAILINTSRGPVVDEADLAAALTSGKLSAAAVDVLCQDPPADGSPLIGLSNCIVTPHIAWAPREARLRLLDVAAANLRGWLAGEPQNVVS